MSEFRARLGTNVLATSLGVETGGLRQAPWTKANERGTALRATLSVRTALFPSLRRLSSWCASRRLARGMPSHAPAPRIATKTHWNRRRDLAYHHASRSNFSQKQ